VVPSPEISGMKCYTATQLCRDELALEFWIAQP